MENLGQVNLRWSRSSKIHLNFRGSEKKHPVSRLIILTRSQQWRELIWIRSSNHSHILTFSRLYWQGHSSGECQRTRRQLSLRLVWQHLSCDDDYGDGYGDHDDGDHGDHDHDHAPRLTTLVASLCIMMMIMIVMLTMIIIMIHHVNTFDWTELW